MTANSDTLIDMGFPLAKALYALNECGDSVERAMEWLFSPEGMSWEEGQSNHPPGFYQNVPSTPTTSGSAPRDVRFDPTSVVVNEDVGMDDEDDEMKQAMQMSLGDSSSSTSPHPLSQYMQPPRPPTPNPNFGPSNKDGSNLGLGLVRMPDAPLSEEQALQKALDESILSSSNHAITDLPPSETSRSPGAPVCLWTGNPGLDYAAGVVQGLQAVPQLRILMYSLVVSDLNSNIPEIDTLGFIMEVFRQMDESDTSYLDLFKKGSLVLPSSNGSPAVKATEFMGRLFTAWSRCTEHAVLHLPNLPSRLAALLSAPGRQAELFESSGSSGPDAYIEVNSVIDLAPTPEHYTIELAIAQQLWSPDNFGAFIVPAEVMAVSLRPQMNAPRKLFEIAEEFYVDRFLSGNSSKVAQIRANEGILRGEEADLRTRKEKVAMIKGKDVRRTLVTAIKYYKEVSRPSEDPEREASRLASTVKLEKLLAELDAEQESINASLKTITETRTKLFDTPELMKYKYELRSILYHDGLSGPGDVYSYVRASDGKWWKMSDGNAKEVETKQALGDASGLHLAAGPYALIYSKADDFPIDLPVSSTRPPSIASFSDLSGTSVDAPKGLDYSDVEEGNLYGPGVGFEAVGGKDSWIPKRKGPLTTGASSTMDIDPDLLAEGGISPSAAEGPSATMGDSAGALVDLEEGLKVREDKDAI